MHAFQHLALMFFNLIIAERYLGLIIPWILANDQLIFGIKLDCFSATVSTQLVILHAIFELKKVKGKVET